jgi:FtsZ-interacting cell division protein ZipA
VYYNIKSSFPTRAATRVLPATGSPTSNGSSKKTKVGAIAGGVIGGLVVLIAILGLILFCLQRRKKAKKTGVHEAPSAPPAELANNQYHPHEMSTTTNATKYVTAHDRPSPNELPAYSGYGQTQPQDPRYNHSPSNSQNLSQPYGYTASHSAGPRGSPQDTGYNQSHASPVRSPNTEDLHFPSDHTTYNTQQGSQYSYPTPTSPNGRDLNQEHAVMPSSTPTQFYGHEVSLDASSPREGLRDGRNGHL